MTHKLDMPSIIRFAVGTVRQNIVLMAPTVISIALSILISSLVLSPLEDLQSVFLQLVLAVVLNVYAHGVTVAMAWEAKQRGSTSLSTGALVAWRAISRLLPLSLLIGLSFSIGLSMFLFPGIAAALLFMYTMPAMVVRNMNAFDAIAESVRVVRGDFRYSMGLIGMLGLTSLGLGIMSFGLLVIPVFGVLANFVLSTAFTAVASVIVLHAYTTLAPGEDKGAEDTSTPPANNETH